MWVGVEPSPGMRSVKVHVSSTRVDDDDVPIARPTDKNSATVYAPGTLAVTEGTTKNVANDHTNQRENCKKK